ncbi:hypothetical protein [Prauserella cavernicola]|uniref:Uncharacterized protein n=1 Tax=Prauserella cavernicola TaxID=2800127 RepID=A0A934V3N4_9PSEU|nr:hypothetical protein [Prauserella cavernicola]MBK1787466.1 hypothetical protein [Prauserella cavernicola]
MSRSARRWADDVRVRRERDVGDPDLPGFRRLTVREWVLGRLVDLRRSSAARNALCEHDERTAPCSRCWVRYW